MIRLIGTFIPPLLCRMILSYGGYHSPNLYAPIGNLKISHKENLGIAVVFEKMLQNASVWMFCVSSSCGTHIITLHRSSWQSIGSQPASTPLHNTILYENDTHNVYLNATVIQKQVAYNFMYSHINYRVYFCKPYCIIMSSILVSVQCQHYLLNNKSVFDLLFHLIDISSPKC